MLKNLLSIIVITLLSLHAYSQKTNTQSTDDDVIKMLKQKHNTGFFGVSLLNVVPQDEFQTALSKSNIGSGFGFSLNGGYAYEELPIAIGGELGFVFWKNNEITFNYGSFPFTKRDTISTSNNSFPINGFVRFQPNIMNYVFPYVEAFGGMTVYYSSMNYKSNFYPKDERTDANVAFNYGVGAGAIIKLVEFIQVPNLKSTICLDIKGKYSFGTDTKFSIKQIKGEEVIEDNFNSKTNTFNFSVGLLFQFN